MNYRYNLFKSTVSTGDEIAGVSYKKVRNEGTTNARRAKVRFFCEKVDSAKSTSPYWKVLSNVEKPERRPQVRPIKLNNETLAVLDDKMQT